MTKYAVNLDVLATIMVETEGKEGRKRWGLMCSR